MTSVSIETLRQLPQKADEVWVGGVIRLPAWAGDAKQPYRPVGALWASRFKVHMSKPVPPSQMSFDLALGALMEFAADPKLANCRPALLKVNDQALANQLAEALRPAGIEVSYEARIAPLDQLLAHMAQDLNPNSPPPALGAPGVTVERMRAFAEAAKAFHEKRPWRYLNDHDPIQIDSPLPDKSLRIAIVMGSGGETFGVSFYPSLARYDQLVSGAESPSKFLSRGESHWGVTFDKEWDLAFADADLWRDHQLPLAAPNAYPVAINLKAGGVERPDARTLAFFEGILRALAQTSEEELDSGRWNKTVPTAEGPMEFALSLPYLQRPPKPREPAPDVSSPQSIRRTMERMMQQLHEKLQEKGITDIDEANRFLEQEVIGKELPRRPAQTPQEQAQELLDQAYDAKGRRQLQLAREAIRLDPDCADAYVLLAGRAGMPSDACNLYAQGMAAAERALGPDVFREAVGDFWGILETRPYMRARMGLADCLRAQGKLDEAAAHYRELLRLNPNDNQGVRDVLGPLLLELGRDDELAALLDQYKDTYSAMGLYQRALLTFRRQKDSPEARRHLAAALKANRHVAAYLLGKKELPDEMPGPYSLGSDDEAVICVMELGDAWRSTPGALEWLAAQTRKATAKRTPKGKKKRK